jgi:hypothetical protein
MRRPLALAAPLALLTALSAPALATAHVADDQYQVLSARNASAAFSSHDGCLETDVFISSTDAVFGGRPGPVNKQGLTSLAYLVYDTCQPMEGKHFPIVFGGQAQNLTPMSSTPRLDRAWVTTSFELVDEVSAAPVPVTMTVTWQLVGALSHDTSHSHVRSVGDGIVNGHDNDLLGDATGSAVVVVDGNAYAFGPSSDAHLELIKAHCQKIDSPHQRFDSLSCI